MTEEKNFGTVNEGSVEKGDQHLVGKGTGDRDKRVKGKKGKKLRSREERGSRPLETKSEEGKIKKKRRK